MPLISSDFYSSWWLVGGHLQTLLPSFLRFVSVSGRPVGIDLPDGDRLSTELYRYSKNSDKRSLLILTHGLEGSARQPYILGMVKAALVAGYDVLAWNLLGCGDIDNLSPKLYHSGSSEDLDAVVHCGL